MCSWPPTYCLMVEAALGLKCLETPGLDLTGVAFIFIYSDIFKYLLHIFLYILQALTLRCTLKLILI